MKYKCIPCDHEFEVKKGVKPRCPRCLKIHDLELISETEDKQPKSKKRSMIAPIIVLAIAGVIGITYQYTKQDGKGDTTSSSSVTDSNDLFENLGIPKEEAIDPCKATKQITAFAQKISEGESGLESMERLYNGIIKLKDGGKWTPHLQREPRKERPLTATKLLEKLQDPKTTEPWRALSYELSCMLLSAARSVDLDARLVEIKSFHGEKSPADPEGKLGRYGVVLGEKKDAPLFDLWGGRSKEAAKANTERLGQSETMAPYFGIGALSLLIKQEMSGALKLNDIAIKLDAKSPHFRSGRGFIFASTGVPEESLIEFEKALKNRPGPVQRVNLAEILMVVNPMDRRPETEVQAALKEMPDFARAHLVKAMLHLMRQEADAAETELALAEKLDPKSPSVAMYWARYHAARADAETAIAKAKQAVQLSEESISSLLGLAGVYREMARFDEMRSTLDDLFKKVDTPEMAEQIKLVFNYDPDKDEEIADGDTDDLDVDSKKEVPNYELKLGEGLGKGSRPSLGGGKSGPSFGGGGDKGLKLDMNLQ